MTDQEAKALEAASRQFKERDHGLTEACRAYHAAMLKGRVVISREDAESAEVAMRMTHRGDIAARIRAQLGEGK